MTKTINEKEISKQRAFTKQHIAQVAMNMSIQTTQENGISGETLKTYRNLYNTSNDIDEKRDLLSEIGESNSPEAVNFLIEALNAKQSGLREEAIVQLNNHVHHPKVIDALIRMLDDEDDTILMESIESLSTIPDERVIAKLLQISEQHPNKIIREVAIDYALQLQNN